MRRYEQFPHTADIGVRAYGRTLKELFENAAFAMFDIIADLEGLKGTVTQEVTLKAPNREELLVAWLDELLYNFYTRSVIFSEFDIKELADDHLKALVRGRPAGQNKNRLKTEIKAATYSGLKIKEVDGVFSVEIIFDV